MYKTRVCLERCRVVGRALVGMCFGWGVALSNARSGGILRYSSQFQPPSLLATTCLSSRILESCSLFSTEYCLVHEPGIL